MAGVLKRKFAEVEDGADDDDLTHPSPPTSSPASSEWESDSEDFTPHSPPAPGALPVGSIVKKPRRVNGQRHVRFDQVTVFSFPRCQGFISVPRRGGATLGMRRQHSALRRYTVAEHEAARRRRQARLLRLRPEEWEDDPVANEDAHLGDGELEGGGSLQPYSSKQRQALLLAAGVKRIDREEKKQLHALRLSREACGCDCQGFCEPETCACSLAGIKCQVDRFTFPCGCAKDSCGNAAGRVEFDSKRVQTHYIHTVTRLQLERRLQDGAASSDEERSGRPEDLKEARPATAAPCNYLGFTLEEDNLTLPTRPSFILLPERSAGEDTSCSSDMSESSCSSSDCDAAGHEGGPCALSICDSDNNNYSVCDQLRLLAAPRTPNRTTSRSPDGVGAHPANNKNYLDENANPARGIFDDEDSLEGLPNTPSPTLDYRSSGYMDPSLSSDSDLEFFDSDYPAGPLHSSFKEHSFRHLQLISSVYLPACESSAYLLESLMGLTEPSPQQPYDNQLA
ncbi:cysteine/serine-rich nuclear protein 1-like [Nerophis ophidion]|uniref:cysteine/serine-rich nuclear protein 1-like n=1 Tax=Nerophis ophidion TaxID=159077 RepID=UPI002ADFD638|nr:cysteine/serine-rich nuclear protein 1-like [Nerophis ophidion]XP_061746347.1 cysteine/serine-rich nuclear protein 1-like [Nerophis ophidion]XP_061746349.1 cysteine/serine-rich nuclear protein 1-like [Nerophis ophidion]